MCCPASTLSISVLNHAQLQLIPTGCMFLVLGAKIILKSNVAHCH